MAHILVVNPIDDAGMAHIEARAGVSFEVLGEPTPANIAALDAIDGGLDRFFVVNQEILD